MFTTLLVQLYPPLKGFSHSLDTYVCKPLPAALQGDDSEFVIKMDLFATCPGNSGGNCELFVK